MKTRIVHYIKCCICEKPVNDFHKGFPITDKFADKFTLSRFDSEFRYIHEDCNKQYVDKKGFFA